jgi:hypothetical protein
MFISVLHFVFAVDSAEGGGVLNHIAHQFSYKLQNYKCIKVW